jgi:general secretion pathway protein D
VPRSELIPLLEMLLRQNGQVMVREEGLYKIMPANLGTRGSVTPQVATTPAQLPNGYSVQIVQLKFAGVRDMARILEPYAVEPQSSIRVDELRNLLILSGTQRELKHMMEVIGLFDVDYLSGYSVGLFPMQTDVKSLSADLDRIFGSSTSGPVAPGPAGAAAAAAASANPLAGIVRIVPIERLNGLLVITTQPRYLEEARKWIDRLDKGGGLSGGMRLNVYPVQNGRADRLASCFPTFMETGLDPPALRLGQHLRRVHAPQPRHRSRDKQVRRVLDKGLAHLFRISSSRAERRYQKIRGSFPTTTTTRC